MAVERTSLRAINTKIARSYDRVRYEPDVVGELDPEWVLGLAALYGVRRPSEVIDVLDLGCGTGAQLERVASMTSGRLVGTDLSRSACERAAERTMDLGDRVDVRCVDFLDLNRDDLGQFDLIYHVGVSYVIPAEVRTAALALIAECLRPGGVALISYHSGTVPLLLAGIRQALRACIDGSRPEGEQVQAARSRLHEIEGWLSRDGGDHAAMRAALRGLARTNDVVFFHEMLNECFTPLSTAGLEAELSSSGVHFLNWIKPGPFGELARAMDRALVADAVSFADGGYRYGVFAKCEVAEEVSARSPDLLWETRLTRIDNDRGEPVFCDGSDDCLRVINPVTEALLDLLSSEPYRFAELRTRVAGLFAGRLQESTVDEVLNRDLVGLWSRGLVRARWQPVPAAVSGTGPD